LFFAWAGETEKEIEKRRRRDRTGMRRHITTPGKTACQLQPL
jgi:hypothetical protein